MQTVAVKAGFYLYRWDPNGKGRILRHRWIKGRILPLESYLKINMD